VDVLQTLKTFRCTSEGVAQVAQIPHSGHSEFDIAVASLLTEIRILMRQEIGLARHEVQNEIGKVGRALLWFVISMVLAGIGLCVVAATCVLILFEYTGLPAWACAVIVSIALLGGAWGLAVTGLGLAKSVRIVPQRTIQTILGDAKWIADWVRTRM
jgi:uncharacterized membrane protein YqjE